MKKILISGIALFALVLACEAKDYAKLHIQEMEKAQKYSTSKTYFNNYAPEVISTSSYEIKDPKLITLGNYKEVSEADYKAKLVKDNAEYLKISKFLSSRKVDNYNAQAYGEDFYKIYRITERLIRANNLDFINWRLYVNVDESFNAGSVETNCIIINTGAYDTLRDNDDAMALLIAHELAHSVLGHSARKAKLINDVERAVRVNNYWYHLFRRKKLYRESRKMEFAADAEGAKFALKAGYDLANAKETISFINTMGNAQDSYSTHPKPEERLKNYEENRKYFMDEEWIKEGRYNIYTSSVLECLKSSERHSLTIARAGKKSKNESYQPESLEQLYLRFGYKSYVNGEFEKAIEYFQNYLGLNKSNYAVYLYISYAYEYLYKGTGKEKYLELAKEFAGYSKSLNSNDKYVKEQILAL